MTLYALDGKKPEIDPDSWVAPDANVIGKVHLNTACSIWFGATLRGDNAWIIIGAGSNIQDNSVLHTDPDFPLSIGENCTIGHAAILHGCTIGNTTLIGMGATILNGAVIGENCLVGAGALVTENKEIPDNSLVMGTPGKVVREVSAEHAQRITEGALHYQENMRRFRDTMKAIN